MAIMLGMVGPRSAWAHRRGCRRERGAATLEYVGVLLIVASLLTVSLGTGKGALVDRVSHAVCAAQGTALESLGLDPTECAEAPAGDTGDTDDIDVGKKVPVGYGKAARTSDLPLCTASQLDRLRGVGATVAFLHGEAFERGQLQTYVDPVTGDESGQVIIAGGAGFGLEAAVKFGPWLDAGGRAVVDGQVGTVYRFDDAEEAEDYFDENRWETLVSAVVPLVVGGSGGNAAIGLAKKLGIVDEASDEELEEYEENDDHSVGDYYAVSLQANLWASFESPTSDKAGAHLDAGLGGQDTVIYQDNEDGSSKWTFRYDGSVDFAGGLKTSAAKKIPLLGDLGGAQGGGFTGAVQYAVEIDENDVPEKLVITVENGTFSQQQGGASPAGLSVQEGDIVQHTYTLDLTEWENREALRASLPGLLDQDLTSTGTSAAMTIGVLLSDNPLARAVHENAVQTEAVYETSGTAFGLTPDPSTSTGLKGVIAGFEWNDDYSERNLREISYIDHGDAKPTWRPLPLCTAG